MIEVMTSVDVDAAAGLAVLVSGLVSVHEADVKIRLHVLVPEDLSVETFSVASRLAADRMQITFVPVASSLIRGVPYRYLGPSAYFRIIACDLLDLSRVLHIDYDTLLCRSVEELWRIDLEGRAIGAVRNPAIPCIASPGGVRAWREKGLDPRAPYFNTGVLLLDLEDWRRRNHAAAILRIAQSSDSGFVNQGAMNVYFAGAWRELSQAWNQHPIVYSDKAGLEVFFRTEEIEAARDNPAIVHFVGPVKPWHLGCRHPRARDWQALAEDLGVFRRPSETRVNVTKAVGRFRKAWNIVRKG